MKKLVMITMMLMCGLTAALAQKPAEIKFDKLTHVKKSITVRTNGVVEMTRLYIEGEMTE